MAMNNLHKLLFHRLSKSDKNMLWALMASHRILSTIITVYNVVLLTKRLAAVEGRGE